MRSNGGRLFLRHIDDPLATTTTVTTGINNAGQLSGFYSDGVVTRGFVDINGVFTTLTAPGSASVTVAYGINDSGQVVGQFYDGTNYNGFVYANGSSRQIDDPGATATYAHGINDAGAILGNYTVGASLLQGFVDGVSGFTTVNVPVNSNLFGINGGGTFVCYYYVAGGYHSFVDIGGSLSEISVPTATATYAFGINDSEQIAGEFNTGNGITHGFVDTNGSFTRSMTRMPRRSPPWKALTMPARSSAVIPMPPDCTGFSPRRR